MGTPIRKISITMIILLCVLYLENFNPCLLMSSHVRNPKPPVKIRKKSVITMIGLFA